MKKGISAVFACVGAVIGAGFASGREIVVFFTRYGAWSWPLIALAAGVMAWLCHLCMRVSRRGYDWSMLFAGKSRFAVLISGGLMVVTAGAMISAAGHMVALLWPHEWAYALGAAGTMLLVWQMSFHSLRAMGWISAGLSILLVCVLVLALNMSASESVMIQGPSVPALFMAAVSASAYAAMNMMLAIGVVCQSAGRGRWVPAAVGLVIAALLGLSNALYGRHPELLDAEFPIVMLLNGFGRAGFITSAVLLYLSIFTTLTAVIYALRSAVEKQLPNRLFCGAVVLGLPLMVSCAGFGGIVDRVYAPAGFVCLALVFLPLAWRRRKQTLDFCQTIQ